LYFTSDTFQLYPKQDNIPDDIQAIWDTTVQQTPHIKEIAAIEESSTEITTDCAIPDYGAPKKYELPNCQNMFLSTVVTQYKNLHILYNTWTHISCLPSYFN